MQRARRHSPGEEAGSSAGSLKAGRNDGRYTERGPPWWGVTGRWELRRAYGLRRAFRKLDPVY